MKKAFGSLFSDNNVSLVKPLCIRFLHTDYFCTHAPGSHASFALFLERSSIINNVCRVALSGVLFISLSLRLSKGGFTFWKLPEVLCQ